MADTQRIEDLRRRVQRDPTSIAFAQLAEECRRAGRYREAIDICRTGLHLHPGYTSARVTLARALIELSDLDAALAELEHVLESAPENLAAIRGIAQIHHRRGSFPQALAHYRAALALAQNDPELQRTVDELARAVDPPSSASTVEPEVTAAPPDVPAGFAPVYSISRLHVEDAPEDATERARARRVVAVLERWIEAIHVARAHPLA